jgi:hypothetical protein
MNRKTINYKHYRALRVIESYKTVVLLNNLRKLVMS